MYRTMISFVTVAAVCAIAAVALAAGETCAKPMPVTVKGVVRVTWDDEWNPTAVTVSDTSKKPAIEYGVVLDAKGVDLANQLEGSQAEIAGLMTEDKVNKTKTLTVKTFKATLTPEVAIEEMQEEDVELEAPDIE